MRTRTLLLVVLVSAIVAFFGHRPAIADEERNFAGSAQLDYHLVTSDPTAVAAPGPSTTFEGFTVEAAVKAAIDISDHLSANVKVCYGCHGFELDMAYFDFRVADEFNIRAGRFSPSFGAFNLRHDPANHMTSDKPLPYDMGRMLRKGDWNNGVLPSPFPTNGVELNGTHWMGDVAQFDYAAYAVMGFKNDTDANPTDLELPGVPSSLLPDERPATGDRRAHRAHAEGKRGDRRDPRRQRALWHLRPGEQADVCHRRRRPHASHRAHGAADGVSGAPAAVRHEQPGHLQVRDRAVRRRLLHQARGVRRARAPGHGGPRDPRKGRRDVQDRQREQRTRGQPSGVRPRAR